MLEQMTSDKQNAPRTPERRQQRTMRPLRHGRWRRAGLAYGFVAPALVLIGAVILYPLARSVYDSLHVDSLLKSDHSFIGLHNYLRVLQDPAFQRAARNTAEYTLFATVGSLLFGTVIAQWLHSLRRGRALFLVLIILPWAVPGTVAGLLWSLILNPTSGLLNAVLKTMHVIHSPHIWLSGSTTAIAFVSFSLIWQATPITALILLTGIEAVPTELYEAAAVDGAGEIRRFFHVTLPLLRPAIAISLVNVAVIGIGVFDQVYVLTQEAPATISSVIQTYLYAFQDLNFGLGIAASMLISLATLAVSLVYLKGIYREVEY